MLQARTLGEGHVYLNLMVADLLPPDDPEASMDKVTVTEGEDAWSLVHRTDGRPIEGPFAAEAEAAALGVRFGAGVSEPIEAGQWMLVATTCGRRALTADLSYDGLSEQAWDEIVDDWEFAVEAAGETVKFLPELAEELPECRSTQLSKASRARILLVTSNAATLYASDRVG